MDEFKGKVALITGAGRGFGREIALAFSSLGVAVAANDINPINLGETVDQIIQTGGNARAYVFDIAKLMPIEGMVAQVMDHFGRIDILVNHASVEPDACILDMDEWEFHRTLDVNLGGPFFCMQQVGRVMQKRGGGRIVNIVSPTREGVALKGCAAYSATQAGLLSLTRTTAAELFSYNIRVNAICTDVPDEYLFHLQRWDISTLNSWIVAYPSVRLGELSDIVRLTLFLCSNAASSLTGQLISV